MSHLKKMLDNFQDNQMQLDNSFFSYFRNISTLSVGLIGLLVGLKPSDLPNQCSKYLFLTTIILIGLCILFSLGVQFYEIVSHRKLKMIQKNHILQYVDDPDENALQITTFDKPKIYMFFEIATFSCLILSISSLIIYAYFLVF